MDKIKNSSLYKKAETIVGAGQGQHATTPQTAENQTQGYGGNSPSYQQSGTTATQSGSYPGAPPTRDTHSNINTGRSPFAGGAQQADDYARPTTSHLSKPSGTSRVGSGVSPGQQQDPLYNDGVGGGAYAGQQQDRTGGVDNGTYSGHDSSYTGVGSELGGMATDPSYTGNVGSGTYGEQLYSAGAGMGGSPTSAYPTGRESVSSWVNADQQTGGGGSGAYHAQHQDPYYTGAVGRDGYLGQQAERAGCCDNGAYVGQNASPTGHGTNLGGTHVGTHESHATGGHGNFAPEGRVHDGAGGTDNTAKTAYMNQLAGDMHHQYGYGGSYQQPGNVTGNYGTNVGTHPKVQDEKPSMADRAKGILNKVKGNKGQRKEGESSSSSSDGESGKKGGRVRSGGSVGRTY